MKKRRLTAQYLIITGIVMLLLFVGQFGEGQRAWAEGTYYQTVPTRTPEPGSGDGDSSNDQRLSQISGVVMDLSTGSPGAGVTVLLNDIEVRTDSVGAYSLSGLNAGEFTVSLILEGDAQPAQDPIVVTVDGVADVTVNLDYYSVPVSETETEAPEAPVTTDSATETVTEEAEESPPVVLPTAGATGYGTWSLLVMGLSLLLLGLLLRWQPHWSPNDLKTSEGRSSLGSKFISRK